MKSKKVLAMLLVSTMTASMMTGCGSDAENNGSTTQDTAAAEEGSSEETMGTETTEDSEGVIEASEEEVTISFWHTYCGSSNSTEAFQKALEGFQEENPNIHLDIEEVNSASDSMGTKISTAMAAGEMPDIYTYWGGVAIIEAVKNGLLMDGQEYLDKTTVLKREDINESAWGYYTIDGTLRGFPTQAAYPAFICNTELFEQCGLELPETMQDVIDSAAVFKEKDIIPMAMGSSGGNPGHFFVSELEHQVAGGNEAIATFGETDDFNNEKSIAAAQVICDLQQAGVFPTDTVANGDWGPSFELYNSGKAAMIYTYSWAFSGISDEMYGKSQLVNMPKIDNCEVDPSGFVQNICNYGFVVTQEGWAESEAKQNALVKLIDFMYSDEVTQALVDGGNPTVRTNWGGEYQTPIMQDVIEFNEGREVVTAHFNATTNSDGWSTFLIKCDELFAGNLTAEQFAEDIQKAYDGE